MTNIQVVNTNLPDLIELRGVTQIYPGNKVVLQDLNFLIEDIPGRGQFDVIMGVSGCGKSTILRYLAGLTIPTSGEVLIHGHPREEETPISMVFQQYSSFPWMSVLKNVALPLIIRGIAKKEASEKAMQMLDVVGLEEHSKKYAKAPDLSGGQLQRVAIARSLIANPEMLLMDEPFGALDVYTRGTMQDMLLSIWERLCCTILFITHDVPEAVYLADNIYIMKANPGEIVSKTPIDLPRPRVKEQRRGTYFTQVVAEIEDMIIKTQQATAQS